VTNLFGGLLGSTFNYVFQHALESLQDGDRFYYLARTPGMNLRTQLEGNSFSELIQRNTDNTHTLKADAFATADCKFELTNLAGTATAFATLGSTVANDPNSECDETALLLRQPDGTIQYKQRNNVDPTGINGQAVYNGTAGVDRVNGGNDNDTFWGGPGADVIDGQGGDDVALGGAGSDRIIDLDGADTLKGGPGNDAMDAGTGDDLNLGGDGNDFTLGGTNDNETFGGEDSDYINAGEGADAVFGDGGDDWIQGGSGQDLLIGDHGAPFFDDPGEAKPGNEVFVGQVGENDYDAEGGDDLMAQNAAIDRNAGAGGYDWAFHQYDTVGGDDDMKINQLLADLQLPVVVNRDRWQETEADSGSQFNDTIRGDDTDPAAVVGGAGFTGCDALDPAGVARIIGLNAFVTTFPTPLADVEAASATGVCPLDGNPTTPAHDGNVWAEGNILFGGGGTDIIEGRGGNDIIDGDKALNVRITVPNPGGPKWYAELMEGRYQRDANGVIVPNSPTLQDQVFKGNIDAGTLGIERIIVDPPSGDTGIDTAVFSGPRASYTISSTGGKLIVNQTVAPVAPQKVSDGIDTLSGIERLQFSDQTVTVATPPAPTNVTVVAGTAGATTSSATVSWSMPTLPAGTPAVTSQELLVTGGTTPQTITLTAGIRSRTVTGLTNGRTYTFQVRAINSFGAGPFSAVSAPFVPAAPPTVPGAPTTVRGTRGNALVTLTWVAPTNTGGTAGITNYDIEVRTGTTTPTVVRTDRITGTAATTGATVTGLTNGTTYSFRVRAVNSLGAGAFSTASTGVVPATVPDAPVIGTVTQGAAGGTLTATVNWSVPASNGGLAIASYNVIPLVVQPDGTTVAQTPVLVNGATSVSRVITVTTPPGTTYRFQVTARNAVGDSVASAQAPTPPATVVPR
jgi:Ca2+-binding RTX toxin-like protein